MVWYDRFFSKNNPENKIVSFEIITLRETGMRGSTEYEIVEKDGNAALTQYVIRYTQGKDQRIPEKSAVVSTDMILEILNNCRILSWDGFNGPHPKGVLDGIMFRFDAIVNNGKKIYAHGSQNFPKHYREFRNALYEILSGHDVLPKE